MAVKALNIASGLYGIINSELKHYDETNSLTPDSSSGTITAIVRGMAQGTTNNTFDGNSILLKKIGLNFSMQMHASATSTRLRIMLIKDTRPQSSLPAITDILSSNTINAFLNIDDQLNRFRVLRDKRVILNTNNPEKVLMVNRAFKRCHVKFTDAQVPVLNDFYVVLLSDESTNTPTVTVTSRLRYYDN